MMYSIDKNLLINIGNYLSRQPYVEVADMITGISQCKPIETKEEKPEKDNKIPDISPKK